MTAEYALERRAKILSSRITARRELLRQAVAPKGSRPPFHEQLSQSDALAFWQEHRHDAIGQKALANMTPESLMELDQALAQAKDRETEGLI